MQKRNKYQHSLVYSLNKRVAKKQALAMKKKANRVTQLEVAEHLFLTARHVRKLITDGDLPGPDDGGYDLDLMRKTYIDYLRAKVTGREAKHAETVESADIAEQIEREKLRKLRRENDEREGLLVESAAVEAVASHIAEVVSASLESLPMVLKRNNPSLQAQDIESAQRVIAGLMNSLSETRIEK
jgi:phage terminase Nu1 subunit (DNA packaging protein)